MNYKISDSGLSSISQLQNEAEGVFQRIEDLKSLKRQALTISGYQRPTLIFDQAGPAIIGKR